MKQSRTQLKQWYKKGLKPLEGQFADWIDSYWHLDDTILPDLSGYEVKASKGLANGYASLDATGKVPLSQLPSLGSGTINAGTVNQIAVYSTTNSISSSPNISIVNGNTTTAGSLLIQPNDYANGNLQTPINIIGQSIPSTVTSGGSHIGLVNILGGNNASTSQITAGSIRIYGGNSVTRGGNIDITSGSSTGTGLNAKGGNISLTAGTGSLSNGVINLNGAVNIVSPPPTDNTITSLLGRDSSGGLLERTVASIGGPRGANFSKYLPTTVANTTSETSLLGTGSGTATIAANELVLGKRYRVFFLTYTSSPNTTPRSVTTRLKIGGTIIYSNILNINTVLINSSQWFLGEFVCTATGLSGSIYSELINTVSPATGTGTVDTTIANTVDVTAQWSDAVAGNTITCNSLSIIPLN